MQSESEVSIPRRMLSIKVMGTGDDRVIVVVMHSDRKWLLGRAEVEWYCNDNAVSLLFDSRRFYLLWWYGFVCCVFYYFGDCVLVTIWEILKKWCSHWLNVHMQSDVYICSCSVGDYTKYVHTSPSLNAVCTVLDSYTR